jgi:hypothetical protein
VEATSSAGATVEYITSASDSKGNPLTPECSPASGSTFPPGLTAVTCTATDVFENKAGKSFNVTVQDTAGPDITVGVSPAANANGWHKGPVMVDWTVSDTVGVDTTSGCGDNTYSDETAELVLTCEATDTSGNKSTRSVTLRIDLTAPLVSSAVSPPANAAGWHNGPAMVDWTVTDANGIDSTTGCDDATYGDETAELVLTCEAVDLAGNKGTGMVTLRIDRTAPVVTCLPSPGSMWPPNHSLVAIGVDVNVSDPLAGANGFTLLSAESNEPDAGLDKKDVPNDIQGFEVGTADTNGMLRAERWDDGAGRLYSLEYQGADVAGNVTSCTALVSVAHDQSKKK